MNEILFFLIVALCGGTVLWSLRRPEGLYLFPALATLTILGWVVPQLARLLDYPDLPDGALLLTMTMIVLSVSALLWGWKRGASALPSLPAFVFEDRRLLLGAVALSVFGAYFRLAIRELPAELLEMAGWSGPQTIYLFFARTQTLALALAWLLFLRTGNLLALAVAGLTLLFFLDTILIGGRRGVIIEIGAILLIGLWLTRRWAPPRAALIAGVLGLTVLFTVIGEFRAATISRTALTDSVGFVEAWQNVREIDFLASFEERLRSRPIPTLELYNATLVIGATQETLAFTGPGNYWDRLVFRYVPGQIVGFDLKQSLMIAPADPMLEVYGAESHPGTTRTGFADAFRAFWLFGALMYFAFAWLMRVCWERGMEGQLYFQFLYLILMKDALHAVTHSTAWFVSLWPYLLVFAAPVFWFAHRRHTVERSPHRNAALRPLVRRRTLAPLRRLKPLHHRN